MQERRDQPVSSLEEERAAYQRVDNGVCPYLGSAYDVIDFVYCNTVAGPVYEEWACNGIDSLYELIPPI